MIRSIVHLVAPIRCVACRVASDGELCGPCAEELEPVRTPICLRCGLPSPKGGFPDCRACRGIGGFRSARSLLLYTPHAGRLALTMKRRGRPALAAQIGRMLADLASAYGLGGSEPTVVFVPGGRESDRRGFDHAELIARAVGQTLGAPVTGWLRRASSGRRQSEVPLHMRRSNAAGRFSARRARGTVLLVDDVFTTGATIEACSLALVGAGADAVDVVTFARTPRLRALGPGGASRPVDILTG
ncbi:MAG TPA: double zinc ribbon domain-containing protein [Actinomycetota bacterium]|nr:double zinc ribbon domain-containing protein [Actinomycetota bacterium]